MDRHPKITISPQYLKKIPANVSRLCEETDEGRRRKRRKPVRRDIEAEGLRCNESARTRLWPGGSKAAGSANGDGRSCAVALQESVARQRWSLASRRLASHRGSSFCGTRERFSQDLRSEPPAIPIQPARNLRLPHKLPATARKITANAIRPHCGSESPKMGG